MVRRGLESLDGIERGLIVAVSGGPDSVALARAVLAANTAGPVVLAHLNHLLRGEASDADEVFVVDLHGRLIAGTPNFHCARARRDVGAEAAEQGANLEAHARQGAAGRLGQEARACLRRLSERQR